MDTLTDGPGRQPAVGDTPVSAWIAHSYSNLTDLLIWLAKDREEALDIRKMALAALIQGERLSREAVIPGPETDPGTPRMPALPTSQFGDFESMGSGPFFPPPNTLLGTSPTAHLSVTPDGEAVHGDFQTDLDEQTLRDSKAALRTEGPIEEF